MPGTCPLFSRLLAWNSSPKVKMELDQYELLDFGNGRKLERIGGFVLDRPAPGTDDVKPTDPSLWATADAVFSRKKSQQGEWKSHHESIRWPKDWAVSCGSVRFTLKPTDVGHIGLFPEQARNWDWIGRQLQRASGQITSETRVKVLNLFAYTGGSTLAAAAAGAEVVHVDSARNTVAWAKRNAASSGLDQAPIRWITEDAMKFVQRELKRQNDYHAVILDPPSYGHGPHAETWKLNRDLHRLLQACGTLTEKQRCFFLLTCHSTGLGAAEVEAILADAVFGHCQSGVRAQQLYLETSDGRRLPSGIVARWPQR